MDDMDSRATAADLHQMLAGISFTGLAADEVTDRLTTAVVGWGVRQGWMASREVPSRATREAATTGRRGHHGYLDVVFERWGLNPVVVEIDRGNKQWSLDKLVAEHEAGCVAVWVRWGRRPPTVPEGVGLVHLPVTMQRGTVRRYSTAWGAGGE